MPFDSRTTAEIAADAPASAPASNSLVTFRSKELIAAAERYAEAKRAASEAEKVIKRDGKILREAMGSALKAVAGKRVIVRNEIAESPGTLITKDMVGQTIGGRRAYDTLSVS